MQFSHLLLVRNQVSFKIYSQQLLAVLGQKHHQLQVEYHPDLDIIVILLLSLNLDAEIPSPEELPWNSPKDCMVQEGCHHHLYWDS